MRGRVARRPGCVVEAVTLTLTALGCLAACGKGSSGGAGSVGSADATQVYTPKSGLVRLHYPPELVANPSNEDLTFLEPTRAATVSSKSLIAVTTNPDPITQDAGEYARVLQGSRAKSLTGYRLLGTMPGRCWNDAADGVETRWEFDDNGTKMQGRACVFMHNHHAFSLMYAWRPSSPGDEAVLRRIVDATEITD